MSIRHGVAIVPAPFDLTREIRVRGGFALRSTDLSLDWSDKGYRFNFIQLTITTEPRTSGRSHQGPRVRFLPNLGRAIQRDDHGCHRVQQTPVRVPANTKRCVGAVVLRVTSSGCNNPVAWLLQSFERLVGPAAISGQFGLMPHSKANIGRREQINDCATTRRTTCSTHHWRGAATTTFR